MKKPVFIPGRNIEMVNGKTFVRIAKKDNYVAKMFLGSMYTRKTTLLKKTTVLEKICEARYKKILEIVGLEDDAIESARQTKKRVRMSMAHVSKVPPTICIDTPRIGDVEGIRMEVSLGWANETNW